MIFEYEIKNTLHYFNTTEIHCGNYRLNKKGIIKRKPTPTGKGQNLTNEEVTHRKFLVQIEKQEIRTYLDAIKVPNFLISFGGVIRCKTCNSQLFCLNCD